MPAGSRALDFECEIGVVVGRRGSDLSPDEGEAAIFGYTVFNDWSAREVQSREMQVGLGPCKGKDFATTLGPWIVTADELEPAKDADGFLDLVASAWVNGERVGHDLVSHIGWTFGTLVAHASRDSVVAPGDVLGSGTDHLGAAASVDASRLRRTGTIYARDGRDWASVTIFSTNSNAWNVSTRRHEIPSAWRSPAGPRVDQRGT